MGKRLADLPSIAAVSIDADNDQVYVVDGSAGAAGDRRMTVREFAAAVATANPIGSFQADTLTALKAIASSSGNRTCVLRGNASAFDGEGGLYSWVAGASDADNPLTVVRPSDYPGTVGNQGVWKKVV